MTLSQVLASDWSFGFIGTAAVVTAGVLLSRFRASEAIRYLGENSIVVYLSFFVFMATSRAIALTSGARMGPGCDLACCHARGAFGSGSAVLGVAQDGR